MSTPSAPEPGESPTASPTPSSSASPTATATPSPTLDPIVSPCPHTPKCPSPGPCLPFAVRTSPPAGPNGTDTPKNSGGQDGTTGADGSNHAAGTIRKFAGTVSGAAGGVDELKNSTPRFEGWSLVPLAGIPIIGLSYVNRFNTISDTWADSADILKNLLTHSGEKLMRSADNYTLVNQAIEKTIGKIRP